MKISRSRTCLRTEIRASPTHLQKTSQKHTKTLQQTYSWENLLLPHPHPHHHHHHYQHEQQQSLLQLLPLPRPQQPWWEADPHSKSTCYTPPS
ncbi:unnamed protein product [Closterium sp. NIES-64]|nr:unnamed protein product [Closterium sp. NIES-64]